MLKTNFPDAFSGLQTELFRLWLQWYAGIYTVNSESLIEISQNGEIPLLLTDVGKSCFILISNFANLSLNTILEIEILANSFEFTLHVLFSLFSF